MASRNSIAPFPANEDRHEFAHWLTGFTDGEGSFFLRVVKNPGKLPQPYANFRIALRADDSAILELIQSFFGCGGLNYNSNRRSKITNAKPVRIFDVSRTTELVTFIIPHFERYPLRAKKRNDFLIWQEGVRLLDTVQRRPWKYRPGRAANRHGGCYPKWTMAERDHFESLQTALREQRGFSDHLRSSLEMPEPPPAERTLFDGLS